MGAKVVVDGATGYIGNHLIAELARQGVAVTALAHRNCQSEDLQFLNSVVQKVFSANLDEESGDIDRAFAGADTAVHLIGSIAPENGLSFAQLHISQTEHFVRLCRKHAIKHIVAVTALGTQAQAESMYHKSKWQAEKIICESGINFKIARPSLIVGHQIGKRDSKLVKKYRQIIETKPFVPLIAGGKNRIQPIFIGDLVTALCRLINPNEINSRTFEIAGPQIVTMAEFIECLMAVLKKQKPIVRLPSWLARLIAAYSATKPGVPLISNDQVKLAEQDNVAADNMTATLLGDDPLPLEQALKTYLNNQAN